MLTCSTVFPVQRAYRSYVKRKQLSKWFHSHRHQSFQRSLLSDRLWNSMARWVSTVGTGH